MKQQYDFLYGDVIGIRDDMYIGKGNAYMHQVSMQLKKVMKMVY
ncbi:MAG: hypothetical protein ACLRZ2_01080 [Veillonella sp.]